MIHELEYPCPPTIISNSGLNVCFWHKADIATVLNDVRRLRMLRHTFRRTTLRTWLGLESQRDAFRRYKAIRRAEREFFPDVKVGGRV
jgi:hypothetical protein